MIKLTQEEFIKRSKKIHNNKYDYKQVIYINSKVKVKIKCNTCNKVFEQVPNRHLNGYECNYCNYNNRKLTTENFIKRSKKIHNNKYDYSQVIYIHLSIKVQIKCNTCNINFEQLPHHHLSGQTCKNCYIHLTDTLEQFINKAKLVHKDKYDYDLVEYINTKIKVKIKCNKCNNIFEQLPCTHINGRPKCKFSTGELKCEEILQNMENVKEFISQYRFDYCRNIRPLPFDFKVILNNDKYFLIEFNGEQHYLNNHWGVNLKDIKMRDKIKYDYCKNNNINLLILKYTDFNNIENIIKDFIENL